MLIISLDPGESSGASVLSFGEDRAAELVDAFQMPGGVSGFLTILDKLGPYEGRGIWICEKFSPRPSSATGFQQGLKSTLPLVCEGVLIGRNLMPVYTPSEKRFRDPGLQYLVGGKDLADKKKRQHKFLKDIGFYRTNKDFPDSPSKDGADDFRSAASHGLAYLARELHHKPTFELISNWEG